MNNMEDNPTNIRKITRETISNQSKTCPICKSNSIDTMGFNAVMKFQTPEKEIALPIYPITYICLDCGCLMFFTEGNVDLDKLNKAE